MSLADPYDERLRTLFVEVGRAEGYVMHDRGTVVVVNGPRFSTRAESEWFGKMGWDVVNMTQHPEAALAREAGIPFGAVALVTDYDAGLGDCSDIVPVTQEQVFALFERNLDRLRTLLSGVITRWSALDVGAPTPGPARRSRKPIVQYPPSSARPRTASTSTSSSRRHACSNSSGVSWGVSIPTTRTGPVIASVAAAKRAPRSPST